MIDQNATIVMQRMVRSSLVLQLLRVRRILYAVKVVKVGEKLTASLSEPSKGHTEMTNKH